MRPLARRRLGALVLAAVLTGCANDAGVRTLAADDIASAPTDPSSATDAPTDDPVFTLPDLTLPPLPAPDTEPVPDTAPAPVPPTTTSEPPTASAPAPTGDADDLVGAGDSLYPEIGNADIDVTAYVVRIDYDPAEQVIDGAVTITLTALTDLEAVVLDAYDLGVTAVTVDGAAASFDETGDELVIGREVGEGEEVDVDVAYERAVGGPTPGIAPDIGWFPTPTGSYVLNEPDGLRTWMPADDHPGDKATWRFELTLPDGLAGIANGELVETIDAGDGATWVWEQRDPMSTYLVQLLTGEYEVVDGGTAGAAGVPLVHVALTRDVERMQGYFDVTAAQLEYFETVFGPYPLDRYGLAFTESYPGLAMETQGRSMFSRDDFPGLDAGGRVPYLEDLLLSHELAHQWFGDAVSPADWGDLWLNESFATYGQWMWFDHTGVSPIEASAEFGLTLRQTPTEPTGSPSVGNLFGIERYDGGAVVLHALRLELGDEDFLTILQRWVADNDGTSRTTEDFIALSEEVAGRSLTAFFDEWLFADVVPAAYPD